MRPRLLIIGLDCAEPSLVFDQWAHALPNLARLMHKGHYGTLESCIPAITVPAWSCMLSGRDPGELGIYGFRNRTNRDYQKMGIANGSAVREKRLWDFLGEAGWRCGVVGVPGTYPPPPINGVLVSGFLAPSTDVAYTSPASFAEQIAARVGDYLLDVPDFRSEDKPRILNDVYTLCEHRFAVASLLLEQEPLDMLMLVEMGVDRIHHAFWRHMDPRHPLYIPDSPFANAIFDYYCHVDRHIGDLLSRCDEQTAVLVASDHGARPLMGGVCLNEWLIAEGYLTLREQPAAPVSLDQVAVDWGRTRAWGAGGYYGRVFLNVQGREPQGTIALADYERERDALAEQLRAMAGPDGHPLGNRVFVPREIYRRVRGIAPDLIVYFGDLAWRSVGTVGGGQIYTRENDTGPDDANHAQQGLFIWHDPQHPGGGQRLDGVEIYDVLPTLLTRYGVAGPAGLRGRVMPVMGNRRSPPTNG